MSTQPIKKASDSAMTPSQMVRDRRSVASPSGVFRISKSAGKQNKTNKQKPKEKPHGDL